MDKTSFPNIISTDRTIIRWTTVDDLDILDKWPPYQGFDSIYNLRDSISEAQRVKYWWEKLEDINRCHYSIIDTQTNQLIGIYAFSRIDFKSRVIGNMVVRIRPDYCNKKYGIETLRPLIKSTLSIGIKAIKFDVAATNFRAVKCYQNIGMKITGEFWQKHTGDVIDPNNSIWKPLLPHLKKDGNDWLVRFYWLEVEA